MRITLCGSTKFADDYFKWNRDLAVKGHTVYSVSVMGRQVSDKGKEGNEIITDAEKVMLDLVHLDKILNSDAIVVINVGGYIGESTKREILWAKLQKKHIYLVEPEFSTDLRAAALLITR